MSTRTYPEPERLAIFLVTVDALVGFCQGDKLGARKCKITANALPLDAEVIRTGHDQTGQLCIVLKSQTFAPVPSGEQIPILPAVTFSTVFDDEVAAEVLREAPVGKAVN